MVMIAPATKTLQQPFGEGFHSALPLVSCRTSFGHLKMKLAKQAAENQYIRYCSNG
jgi:hypothetical protein